MLLVLEPQCQQARFGQAGHCAGTRGPSWDFPYVVVMMGRHGCGWQ